MPPVIRRYNRGLVTARDRSELADGEMQQATGIYYKPGDQRAHKVDGRSVFETTGSAAKIDGLYLAEFDSATDQLLALSGGTLYKMPADGSGDPADTGATVTGSALSGAHGEDRHYLCTGSENLVFESDGTVLAGIGMQQPGEGLTMTVKTAAGGSFRPTASSGNGLSDAALAYDDDGTTPPLSTFAYRIGSPAVTLIRSDTYTTFAANADASSRFLEVYWEFNVSEASPVGQKPGFPVLDDDEGYTGKKGASFLVQIEYSENAGTDWTYLVNRVLSASEQNCSTVEITGSLEISTNLHVKISSQYQSGTSNCYLRVRDIKVHSGGVSSAFDITNLLYAYTEYDQDRKWESARSPIFETGVQTSIFAIQLALPAAAVNSNTTHYRIYRTADNGTESQLGKIGEVAVAESNYMDNFESYPADEQPTGGPLPLLRIQAGGTANYYQRNTTPPTLSRIAYFAGSMVGISAENPRQLHYALPAEPQYWPEIFVISAFPLKRNDTLVDLAECSGSLVLAAKEAMIRMDSLPYTVQDTFIASNVVEISGAPGCVGAYAMCQVNFLGASHVAWISNQDGVLVTDGHKWDTISRDIDWSTFDGFDKSSWVLRWLPNLRAVVMYYSSTSGGANDRYYLFHIDSSHVKVFESGVTDSATVERNAKTTGPHYGAVADAAIGVISSTYRLFEGHWSNGIVYLNFDSSTGADASGAYSGTTSPMIVQGGRSYGDWRSFSVIDGRLRHTDFGTGETCTMAVSMGRDEGDGTSSRSKTVSLANQQGTQFDVSLHGEWFEETITHTGTGRGALQDLMMRVLPCGDEGAQKVV